VNQQKKRRRVRSQLIGIAPVKIDPGWRFNKGKWGGEGGGELQNRAGNSKQRGVNPWGQIRCRGLNHRTTNQSRD